MPSSKSNDAVNELFAAPHILSFTLGSPPGIAGDRAREVMFGNMRILFSYSEPIAFRRQNVVRVDTKKHSTTTTRHRNSWLGDNEADDIKLLDHGEFQHQLVSNVLVELSAKRDTLYDIVGETARFVDILADVVKRLRALAMAVPKLAKDPIAKMATSLLADTLGAMMNLKRGGSGPTGPTG